MDKNGEDSYMKSNSYAVFFLTVLFLYAVTTHAASLAGNATDGYYINMPASGTETLTIPSGVTSFKVALVVPKMNATIVAMRVRMLTIVTSVV